MAFLYRAFPKKWTLFMLLTFTAAAYGKSPIADMIPIIHGDQSIERYAARELQSYLKNLTGETLALEDWTQSKYQPEEVSINFAEEMAKAAVILSGKETELAEELARLPEKQWQKLPEGPAFVLGTPEELEFIKGDIQKRIQEIRPASDGYVVEYDAETEKVYVLGRTSRGVLYGVYALLQDWGGMGFFEDGEYLPQVPKQLLLPPFETPPARLANTPEYDYRCQWVWTRYYGADRGHPVNWRYEQWVSHLRWMAQCGYNRVMLYPVGYTRLWGDVHRRAFPETLDYERETRHDVAGFWGAAWSAWGDWGRSPEEVTRLMQKVYAFGREKLGMTFEYNFYLGNFEESLKRAYPEGNWIDWTNLPHHAYFGAAGRSPVLTFTDPRAKEMNQRFFKTFIETFGTDHQYWIAYREESAPNPDNPNDPDGGKSLADAVNKHREWILEIDPQAEFYHWDWHGLDLWIKDREKLGRLLDPNTTEPLTREEFSEGVVEYCDDLHEDITFVSVLPPGVYDHLQLDYKSLMPDLSDGFGDHDWVVGSLLGYAMQDVGVGGLSAPWNSFFENWNRWAEEDREKSTGLRGVLHWNEIVQVNPLLDHLVGRFGWTGHFPKRPGTWEETEEAIRRFYIQRYGEEDAPAVLGAAALLYQTFPMVMPDCRRPQHHTYGLITPEVEEQIAGMRSVMQHMVNLRPRLEGNPLYRRDLVDFGRIALHTIAREHLYGMHSEAKRLVQGEAESRDAFRYHVRHGINAMQALTDLLYTDERHSLSHAIYEIGLEPGNNKLLRKMMLEHASGRLFSTYPLNDTAEYMELVALPAMQAIAANWEKHLDDPEGFPAEKVAQVDEALLQGEARVMELPARPFSQTRNPLHPAEVIARWLGKP